MFFNSLYDKKLENIFNQEKAFKQFSDYIIRRMTELKFGIEFSNIVKAACKVPNKPIQRFAMIDIDKILSVKGEIKAFFELKTPETQQKYPEFIVTLSQFDILRRLSRKVNAPVFYLIRYDEDTYRLIKCNFEKAAITDSNKRFVRFQPQDGILLTKQELIHCIADILQGEPELRK